MVSDVLRLAAKLAMNAAPASKGAGSTDVTIRGEQAQAQQLDAARASDMTKAVAAEQSTMVFHCL